jgi:uncharacterized Zn finger protein
MAKRARVKCSECGEVSEQPIEEMLLDLVDDHNVLLYTCNHCGEFITKPVSEASKLALSEAGVFTVDEMSQWIVEELDK